MYQIYVFAGLYSFIGTILIILFKILPDFIDCRVKKKILSWRINSNDRKDAYNRRKFFPNLDDKTYLESQKMYNFYSTLWSFRLIGTGFMISIIYSIWPSEFLDLPYNSLFVYLDTLVLSILALFGINGVRHPRFNLSHPILLLYAIFGFNLVIYFMVLLFNFTNVGTVIDKILIASTAISQIIFTSLFFCRYYLNKNKNF